MKRALAGSAVALFAAASVAAFATPAHAATPAQVNCNFAEVFTTFDDGQGQGSLGFTTRNTQLTVHEGNGDAWYLTVEEGWLAGKDGWIESDCVVFQA
ncbi:hypothetical protein [Natronoglycomyces albus]|uniref:SH3 domain-containing protein n=1 Tax=Natronoglycomyces albus TaxID=2811108 RepID=A0A895XQ86_9ACTN|nr:hypothetical protein [Natronoglycomyces albus]QSB05882.1 hypothetical protein JQS30_02855 [Natronoglycomyces albus]